MNQRGWIFGALFVWAITGAVAVAALSTHAKPGSAPGGSAPGAQPNSAPQREVMVWEPTFEAAMQKARSEGKPVMVDFYTSWCGACKYLDASIYTDKSVARESAGWITVKVDAEARQDVAQAYGVNSYPTIVFVQADGRPIDVQTGAPQEAATFIDWMRAAYAKWTPPVRA